MSINKHNHLAIGVSCSAVTDRCFRKTRSTSMFHAPAPHGRISLKPHTANRTLNTVRKRRKTTKGGA